VVARRITTCRRRSTVRPHYRRLVDTYTKSRLPSSLRQRTSRGEVGKGGGEGEGHRGFLGGGQDGKFAADL
jgi:hypothetical protein